MLLHILKAKVQCLQSFASQPKQNNVYSIAKHQLLCPPIFIYLFVWQEAIQRYLKISRNREVTCGRQKSCEEKIQPWDAKERNRKHLFQQKATRWITRKEGIGTFRKQDLKIREVIFITDWKSTSKNNKYILFWRQVNTVLIISIKYMCWLLCFYQ